jgi:molecular chaperone HtpG
MTVETLSFQTEVQQLLNLMIHSLYSNKEIFLRELISNSSDALDRLRFEEVTNHNLLGSKLENAVRVTPLTEAGRLLIEDNGIGMTRDELIQNLGTIASSGTKKFMESLKEGDRKDANLIGQFGVGFYSAFMVAERVIVETLSARGGQAYRWESVGDGTFTITDIERTERGTRIELILKPEEKEYADSWRAEGIIKKYSDYITYPVCLMEKDGKERRLNKTTPVWARSKRDNKPEDYHELYKQIAHDWKEPLFHEHISAEGLTSFQSVVFIPQEPPFDLYSRDEHGLHLYVKRVSIMEKCKDLIPEYLRFTKGVVETDELPLNVSREILQQNSKLATIRKQVTKKILSLLQNTSQNDAEKYSKFYEKFGAVLKEGFHFDHDNHETLAELVRFRSSKTGNDGWVSLKEYTERIAKNQKEIFYITGPTYEIAARSPHLEALTARNVEVLFLTDPIDEWFVIDYPKHKDFALRSINKGDIDLNDLGDTPADAPKREETPAGTLAGLLESLRSRLGETIKEVKVSQRLTESACCLVAEEHGMSAHMERLMKATSKDFSSSKKILEVNPSHPLIRNLAELKERGNASETQMNEWIDTLYDTALVAEGSPLKDPASFARRITQIMQQASAH